MASGKSKNSKRPKALDIPLLEWVSAGVGLAIVLGMFGFLTVDAMRADTGVPPIMRAQPTRLTVAPGQYVLQVRVSNSSRKTGASVQIAGNLKRGGTVVESSEATLSYVPGQSERRAGLVFTHDPRAYQLDLRVTGYERP
jgi:uncharacterized protein (TIGR02588 family)